jgi:hypothetical protein
MHMTRIAVVAAVAGLALLCAAEAVADPSPAPQASSAPSASATSSPPGSGNHMSVDPCALLTARDASSVVGAVNSTPQRPSANECLWSAASLTHATGPVSQVLFTADLAQEAKHGCHGLGCIGIVQSVTGMIPGMSSFNSTVSEIGGAATMIQGLGQRAAWANGILAVLQDQVIFKLKLSGTQSDMLDASESLARNVLNNMQKPATPPP